MKHTPWTKRAELQQSHTDHFQKVRRLMEEARQAANHLDMITDCLEVNGGDVQSFFMEEAVKAEGWQNLEIIGFPHVKGEYAHEGDPVGPPTPEGGW
jgi:hypothetical protein